MFETALNSDVSSDVPALEFRSLVKHYGRVQALKGLDLTVRKGEVYGFLGRNGAGKSTAIRIAMGINKPTSGHVMVLGERISANAIGARRRIGYVAQEQMFYPWMTPRTIGQFVGGFYPGWAEDEYERLITQMELPPRRKIRTFSGGMKAKLALALALAHKPDLLILDEPTAGLDAVARKEFIEMVREQADLSQRTTFFSSHLIDEVEAAADRVGIIDDGERIFEGDLRSLTARTLRADIPPDADIHGFLPRDGIRLLHDRTLRGKRQIVLQSESDGLEDLFLPDSWQRRPMSLEEIFIAMVSRPLSARVDASRQNADP